MEMKPYLFEPDQLLGKSDIDSKVQDLVEKYPCAEQVGNNNCCIN